jgi:hypothetical protein
MVRRTAAGAGGVPPRGARAAALREAERQLAAERLAQSIERFPPRSPSPFPPDELERLAAIDAVVEAVRRVVAEEPSLAGWRVEFVTYLDGTEQSEVTVRLEVQVYERAARGNRDG